MAIVRTGYVNQAAFPATGAVDIIYIDLSNSNEFIWTGSYVVYIPTQVEVLQARKSVAWFASNGTILLGEGQVIHLSDGAAEFVDAYVIGNGIDIIDDLPWKGLKATIYTEITEPFTVAGNSFTLSYAPVGNYLIFKEGNYMTLGQKLVSLVGVNGTLDDDYTGETGVAIYKY